MSVFLFHIFVYYIYEPFYIVTLITLIRFVENSVYNLSILSLAICSQVDLLPKISKRLHILPGEPVISDPGY